MSGEFSIVQVKNGFIVSVGSLNTSAKESFIAKTVTDVLNLVKVALEKK